MLCRREWFFITPRYKSLKFLTEILCHDIFTRNEILLNTNMMTTIYIIQSSQKFYAAERCEYLQDVNQRKMFKFINNKIKYDVIVICSDMCVYDYKLNEKYEQRITQLPFLCNATPLQSLMQLSWKRKYSSTNI